MEILAKFSRFGTDSIVRDRYFSAHRLTGAQRLEAAIMNNELQRSIMSVRSNDLQCLLTHLRTLKYGRVVLRTL